MKPANTRKQRSKRSKNSLNKSKTLHQWSCPGENVFLLKAETIFLAVLIILIFIFSFIVFNQKWLLALFLTAFFILVFILITYLFRKFYPVRETYQLTPSGILISIKTKKKTVKLNIKYSEIKDFKLDKLFHGGRIETKTKRHPLYFNTKQEIEKLEGILKKKVKRKK